MTRSRDVNLFMTFCKDFRLCVQAGGHVGVWPKGFADRFETVITFEPDPYLYQCLLRNLTDVVNVFEYPAALGAKPAITKMKKHPSAGSWSVDPVGGTVEVAQTTIDEVVKDRPCDGIVLDIEGYEFEALKGARKTVERCKPPIMVERLPGSTSAIAVQEWLSGMGYCEAYHIHSDVIHIHRG
jgi:FkbM family methyltransferase